MAWHTFLCPSCCEEVSVSVEAVGKVSKCNLCGAAIAVPTKEQDASLREQLKRKAEADGKEKLRRKAAAQIRKEEERQQAEAAGAGKTRIFATHRWKALVAGLAALLLIVVVVGLLQRKHTPRPIEYTPEQRAVWERERAKKREDDDKKAALARAEIARQKAEAEKNFQDKLSATDPAERLKIINAKDEKGSTLLHKAIKASDKTFVEALLGYGADVRTNDGDGRLPINLAIDSGDPEIVRLLLARGADPNARRMVLIPGKYVENEILHTEGKFEQGDFPLNYAIVNVTLLKKGNKEVILELIAKGAQVNADHSTPLFLAAGGCDKEVILLMISKGAKVNAVDASGDTPLFDAADFGNVEAATALIEAGAQVNARNNSRQTPLHGAAWAGKKEMIRLLISKGAQVNAIDKDGKTPLDYANDDFPPELLPTRSEAAGVLRRYGGVSGVR